MFTDLECTKEEEEEDPTERTEPSTDVVIHEVIHAKVHCGTTIRDREEQMKGDDQQPGQCAHVAVQVEGLHRSAVD